MARLSLPRVTKDVPLVFEATTGRAGASVKTRFTRKARLTNGEIELREAAQP